MGRSDQLPTDALIGVHVLIVDDDRDSRALLKTVVEYCGALATAVGSAREALRILQRVTPDAIVTDIAMPTNDGYPAIALTAYGDEHGPHRTLSAGFQAHLRKPIDPWELCRTVASVVRR